MSLKKIGAVLVAVLALSAVMVSSASATATTERAEVYTGTAPGTTLAVGSSLPLTVSIGEHPEIGTKFTLKSSVGTSATPIDLTATGIECVECKVENKEITSKAGAAAFGTGKIKFTGVTAMEPTNCTVSDESGNAGQVITKALNVHLDFMEGTKALQQFIPAAGATTTFAQLKLSGTGCSAIAGSYNVTGTLFSEAKNATGVASTSQSNVFTPTINKNAGGELKIGTKIAELTGTGIFTAATSWNVH